MLIIMGDKIVNSNILTTALALARYATSPPSIATGLLLVDIAQTFDTSVGIMSQIRTSSSTLSIFAAFNNGGIKHQIQTQITNADRFRNDHSLSNRMLLRTGLYDNVNCLCFFWNWELHG